MADGKEELSQVRGGGALDFNPMSLYSCALPALANGAMHRSVALYVHGKLGSKVYKVEMDSSPKSELIGRNRSKKAS